MFAFILPLLNSVFAKAFKSYVDLQKNKLDAGNTSENIAATLAARELTVEQRELEVNAQLKTAEIGKWYEPDHLFGYIMVIYFAKAILWDKVLGYFTNGSTDPILGQLGQWAGWIMFFYVGMRGSQSLARIIKR